MVQYHFNPELDNDTLRYKWHKSIIILRVSTEALVELYAHPCVIMIIH